MPKTPEVTPQAQPAEPTVKPVKRLAKFLGGNNFRGCDDHFPYGGYRSEGIVEIVEEKPGAKHPFKVIPHRGTEVYGWVNKDTIKEVK